MGQLVGNYLRKSTAANVWNDFRTARVVAVGGERTAVVVLPEISPRLPFVAADADPTVDEMVFTPPRRSDEPVVHGFKLKCLADKIEPSVSSGGER